MESHDAVTHHTITIDGKRYAYSARAGTITLRDTAQKPAARMFYVAYTLDGVKDESTRPVTFMYNGGPGSSSVWLRMGSVGPIRLNAPDAQSSNPAPYTYGDNPNSLLDKTDMVFVDAPGTGYSRLLGGAKPADFYGVDQDVRAFTQFISTYITDFDRWNSPKFLFGESYGTTRSSALASRLQRSGIQLNGVVLLSSVLNYGLDGDGSGISDGDWGYVLYLPTAAASAWYHNALPNRPAALAPFLHDVETFASDEYLDTLAAGAQADPAKVDDVVAKLHAYTGLSEQYIRQSNLRIAPQRFQAELLRDRGEVIGRLDARYQTFNIDRVADSTPWDAADVSLSGVFTAVFNAYVRNDLNYKSDLPYLTTNYGEILRNWDFKHGGNPLPNVTVDLATTMTQNPHLQVFSANGYYDFATPFYETVYTLNHLNLAPELQKHITYGFYESGHMIYMHTPSLAALKHDLARWYDEVLK